MNRKQHETESGWKVIQQHGSFPDLRVQEGETLAMEKVTKENLELRDAVKRRTAELVNKKIGNLRSKLRYIHCFREFIIPGR